MPTKTYECEQCHKAFDRNAANMARSKHAFCSPRCTGDWNATHKVGENNPGYKQVAVNCAQCSASLKRPPHKIARSKNFFCSVACRAQYNSNHIRGTDNPTYNRVPALCAGCGKSMLVIPFRVKHHKTHFCNKACYGVWQSQHRIGRNGPNWRGGYKEYYGPDWNVQSRAARKRDNYHCQVCKKPQKNRALDVHHVTPFRSFGYIPNTNERYKEANQLENLISLCASCHQRVEAGHVSVQLKLL